MTATCTCMILNYNDSATVKKLVADISNYPVFNRIVIVDNCSTDGSYNQLESLVSERVVLIKTDRNGGYGYGNNFGTRYIKETFDSDYVLLANPDVVFSNNLIERFVTSLENDQSAALISAIQLDINDQPIKDLAWRVPTALEYAVLGSKWLGKLFQSHQQLDFSKSEQYVECVPGALLLYNTDKFLEVGGYDEEMFLFGEETTIGFKMKERGYKSILILDASYRHEHSVSINKSISQKSKQLEILYNSRLLFMKKYLKSSSWLIALAKYLQCRTLNKLHRQEEV